MSESETDSDSCGFASDAADTISTKTQSNVTMTSAKDQGKARKGYATASAICGRKSDSGNLIVPS